MRRQTEGLGRVGGVHGRRLQPVALVHRLGDQRADQHQGLSLLSLASVQRIAHPAGKGLLQRAPGIGPGHLQLAFADGLARRSPQGGRAQDGRAIEGLALDLAAGHGQGGALLQREAQRLLPIPRAVKRLGQHVHGAAGQGCDQRPVGPGAGGHRSRRPVARQDEQDVRTRLQRLADLIRDPRPLQHDHFGLKRIDGQKGGGLVGRLRPHAARQRIDQDDDPFQSDRLRQRSRRLILRGGGGVQEAQEIRSVVLRVGCHGRRTSARSASSALAATHWNLK
ncbi:hypothetical protein D3C73_939980 [compost metagenome]